MLLSLGPLRVGVLACSAGADGTESADWDGARSAVWGVSVLLGRAPGSFGGWNGMICAWLILTGTATAASPSAVDARSSVARKCRRLIQPHPLVWALVRSGSRAAPMIPGKR